MVGVLANISLFMGVFTSVVSGASIDVPPTSATTPSCICRVRLASVRVPLLMRAAWHSARSQWTRPLRCLEHKLTRNAATSWALAWPAVAMVSVRECQAAAPLPRRNHAYRRHEQTSWRPALEGRAAWRPCLVGGCAVGGEGGGGPWDPAAGPLPAGGVAPGLQWAVAGPGSRRRACGGVRARLE